MASSLSGSHNDPGFLSIDAFLAEQSGNSSSKSSSPCGSNSSSKSSSPCGSNSSNENSITFFYDSDSSPKNSTSCESSSSSQSTCPKTQAVALNTVALNISIPQFKNDSEFVDFIANTINMELFKRVLELHTKEKDGRKLILDAFYQIRGQSSGEKEVIILNTLSQYEEEFFQSFDAKRLKDFYYVFWKGNYKKNPVPHHWIEATAYAGLDEVFARLLEINCKRNAVIFSSTDKQKIFYALIKKNWNKLEKNFLNILRLLLKDGEIDINGKDALGISPITYAILRGQIKLVYLLTEFGADFNGASLNELEEIHKALEKRYLGKASNFSQADSRDEEEEEKEKEDLPPIPHFRRTNFFCRTDFSSEAQVYLEALENCQDTREIFRDKNAPDYSAYRIYRPQPIKKLIKKVPKISKLRQERESFLTKRIQTVLKETLPSDFYKLIPLDLYKIIASYQN